MSSYEQFRWAEDLFNHRDYIAAGRVLERLLRDEERSDASDGHGLTAARELLARAYFHSAQLGRAETTARALLADDPANAYAALLLARVLQRRSRRAEAQSVLNLAAALGAPGTTFSPDAA